MFSKSLFASIFLVALSTQVHGHAAISPVLGVSGTPVRNDVQRPSKGAECGSTNVAATINKSTAIPLVNNAFTTTITNFNGGQDGSTQVTAEVDPTAIGKTFTAATVTKNGVLAPPAAGSAEIAVSLPANTKCTGGANGNLCLVSFTTAGGFGNCVVVSQAADKKEVAAESASSAAGTAAKSAPGSASHKTEAKSGNKDAKKDAKKDAEKDGKKDAKKDDKKDAKKEGKKDAKKDTKKDTEMKAKAAGTRAPRALLAAEMENKRAEAVRDSKKDDKKDHKKDTKKGDKKVAEKKAKAAGTRAARALLVEPEN